MVSAVAPREALVAYLMAPVITKNDKQTIQQEMLRLYNIEISIAMANAMNEEQPDLPPESEIIRARQGTNVSLRGDENDPFPAAIEVQG